MAVTMLLAVTAIAALSPALLVRLAALGTTLVTAILLFYLAYQGRFLSRAVDCALFPAAVLLCSLAAHALRSLVGRRRLAAVLLLLLCLGGTAIHARMTLRLLSDRPDQISATREADLEAYALAHPDQLILRTPNLLRDTRLMPDVSNGIPANIMIWGDWNCRTPSWYLQLEKLGFDGRHFTAGDFLRDNLLFVTEQEAPPEELMQYLREGTGTAVRYELADIQGELRFFRFE